MTHKEKIEKAYNDFVTTRELGYDIDVPENRRLYIGDHVEIGNLVDCIVVETSPDFKKVIVEYTRIDNNYGNPITTTGCIGGWTWFELVPYNADKKLTFATKRTHVANFINGDVSGIVNGIIRRGLIDNPDYQRGYVWTLDDKLRYIKTVFEDRDLGKFVFVEDRTYKDYRLEVLDGKQRLSSLLGFMSSQFPYEGKYYHELSSWDRTLFEGRIVQSATVDRKLYSRAELLKLFLEVNTAGVPQTEEHLSHVRQLLADELGT